MLKRFAKLVALSYLSFFVPSPLEATTFTLIFHDLTDTLTVTAGGRELTGACSTASGEELCAVELPPPVTPTGFATLVSVVPASGSFGPGNQIDIAEPNNTKFVSDEFTLGFDLTSIKPQAVDVGFFSDLEAPFIFLCNRTLAPCQLTEDGTVQTAATATWSDGTVVNIEFQSDVDEGGSTTVPEPSSIILLATGVLGALLAPRRNRIKSDHPRR